ncbi:MAG: glycosyltransferase family 39 protein [Candidatus Yanofskybacteria bacterium]|nr:glycosyltransferase family 39 protein [Candidatus Yanofskybacteria bacterium]
MKFLSKIPPLLVILAALGLMVVSIKDDSFIVDEIPHVGAGYSYIAKGDMRLNPEHPPLVKDLAGIALFPLKLNEQAFNTNFWKTDINGQWEFGRRLIYNSGNDANTITYVARLPVLLFFILTAGLIFRWGRELYGKVGGLIALILFSFSPTIMAHARFVTTDMAALFGIVWATYYFLRYLKHPSVGTFWPAAITFGIALLTKFSTFLLIPFLGLTALVWGFVHASHGKVTEAIKWGFRSVLVLAVGFIIVVWPVYAVHTINYPPERQAHDTQALLSSFGNRLFADPVVWMADKPVLRAAGQYFLGLLMVTQRSTGGNTIYFLGEVKNSGGPIYFPLVYFIKEPLAWWILVFMALVLIPLQLGKPRFKWHALEEWIKKHFVEFAMLLWLAIYWAISIRSNLNIGVRHLLPTYGFAILLVSGQISRLIERAKQISREQVKIMSGLVMILLVWYVFENASVFPNYLTYFNQTVGGPSGGYKYVVDSNLDWGQDLKRLSKFIEQEKIPHVELDYFGWADPSFYLKNKYVYLNSSTYRDARDFLNNNRSNGWIAVSATFLQGSEGTAQDPQVINYTWLKGYEPVTVVGNSIFVWHIIK